LNDTSYQQLLNERGFPREGSNVSLIFPSPSLLENHAGPNEKDYLAAIAQDSTAVLYTWPSFITGLLSLWLEWIHWGKVRQPFLPLHRTAEGTASVLGHVEKSQVSSSASPHPNDGCI